MDLMTMLDPGGTYLNGPDAKFYERMDPGGASYWYKNQDVVTGGKKGGGQTAAPEIQMPEPPEPASFMFVMPEMPAMPQIPKMPDITYVPPENYYEDEIRKANEADERKRNKLRAGRASTISTSPLGVEEEAEVRRVQLLGG
jgi:hypothetical protein